MKAYVCGIRSNDDAGNEVVFAKNSKEAMKKAQLLEILDYKESYIDVYVKRASEFDGMEDLSDKELTKVKWRNGWWFEYIDYPDSEEGTDEEFYEWYENNF